MVGFELGAGVTTESTGDDVGIFVGESVVDFIVGSLDGEKEGTDVGVHMSS